MANKDFKETTAMKVMSAMGPAHKEEAPASMTTTAPPPMGASVPATQKNRKGKILKNLPVRVEPKSRRIQLLMQPSLYDRVKTGAEMEGLSFNEFVHCLLLEALEKKV